LLRDLEAWRPEPPYCRAGKLTDLGCPPGAQVAADKVKPDTWNAHLDCRAHLDSFQTSLVTKMGNADARFGKIGIGRTRWEAG